MRFLVTIITEPEYWFIVYLARIICPNRKIYGQSKNIEISTTSGYFPIDSHETDSNSRIHKCDISRVMLSSQVDKHGDL